MDDITLVMFVIIRLLFNSIWVIRDDKISFWTAVVSTLSMLCIAFISGVEFVGG